MASQRRQTMWWWLSPTRSSYRPGRPAGSMRRTKPTSVSVRSPAHEFLAVGAFSPAHEFFGSRKLRLAPQDYSPWTPPVDRLSGRSYPPASRHPPVLDQVGSASDEHGADGKRPDHALLPRMRASYGPKSGP